MIQGVGSAVLIVHENCVLLGRRNKDPNRGRWILPGGQLESGETHVDAAIREAREETGLTIALSGLAGRGIYYLSGQERMVVYSRAYLVNGGVINCSSDLLDARFVSREQLKDLDITEICRAVLADEGWLDGTPRV